MPMTKTVTIVEAARILGRSRRTVQRMCIAGTLKGEKVAGVWAITLPAGVQMPVSETTDAQAAHADEVAALRALHDQEMAGLRTEHDRALATLRLELAALDKARAIAEAHLSDVTAERDRLLMQIEEAQRQVTALTGALFQMTQRALPAPRKRAWWRFWEREEAEREGQ